MAEDVEQVVVEDAAQRQELAVGLRIQGGSPQEIAEQLRGLPGMAADYDASQAAADVQAGLAATPVDGLAAIRQLDLRRLDDLLREWWERAKADPAALGSVMQIMAARGRLAAELATEPERFAAEGVFDSAAVVAELNRLDEPHAERKRATVLALVDARLAGVSEESVWRRPEVCARRTYHMKWKQDATFADVLARVSSLARDWQTGRAARALAQAAERLSLASPLAAQVAAGALQSADERTRLSAAFGILDRADPMTAAKAAGKIAQHVDVEFSLGELADDDLAALAGIAGRIAGHPGGAGAAASG